MTGKRCSHPGKTRLLLLLITAFVCLGAGAQTSLIKGTVRDASGAPLPGASITVEGTSKGATAGANGGFELQLAPGQYTIAASHVGWQTQQKQVTIAAGETANLDFELASAAYLRQAVVIGSRRMAQRSNTLAPVPVDVIGARELAQTGQVEPGQMLSFAVPSFNSSRQTIADGTDHIDPATLRGLGPDQVLVLVNGRRRYNTALLNVNGTVGRGAVGTDLNAIPAAAINRVEVLRDGAASQYGSDAIAGVINIVLKNNDYGTTFNAQAGQQYEGDGKVLQLGFNHGSELGHKGGFLNISADLRHRGATNRVGDYTGRVYVTDPAADNAMIAARGFSRSHNMQIGNSEVNNAGVMLNMELPFHDRLRFFLYGGGGLRKGASAGFYRYPRQTAQVNQAIYPDGFLPEIHSTILDRSAVAGLEGKLGNGWNWDLSQAAGGNSFRFDVENSNNASQQSSLGALAPTAFYCGQLVFSQYTTNFNLAKDFGDQLHLPSFNVALGGELRFDHYRIKEGEEASYKNYDPASGKAGGAQVFPGFQPSNAVKETRNVAGAYLDLETDLTQKLLVNMAGRFENYSDYGSSLAGKIAARYHFADWFTLRGALSNGFRAPSMQQRWFSAVSTVFISTTSGLQPFQQGNFNNSSLVSQAFGIPNLEAERSTNTSIGFTSRLARNKLSITADLYQIAIKDRIILSSTFRRTGAPESPAVDAILSRYAGLDEVSGVVLFTNAVDTRTRGVDIVTSYTEKMGKNLLTLTLTGNITRTTVQGEPHVATITDPLLKARLFGRDEKARIEEAQPRHKFSFNANLKAGQWIFNGRTTLFGSVYTKDPDDPSRDESFDPRWVTDCSVTRLIKTFGSLTIGANNLFDVYPDKLQNPANTSDGRFIYSRGATQFGFNGGYYYMAFTVAFR